MSSIFLADRHIKEDNDKHRYINLKACFIYQFVELTQWDFYFYLFCLFFLSIEKKFIKSEGKRDRGGVVSYNNAYL